MDVVYFMDSKKIFNDERGLQLLDFANNGGPV